jgi:organic radical activating enzyme
MNEIIIFGAGKKGRQLINILSHKKVKDVPECKIVFVCDNYISSGRYVQGIEVIHPEDIKRIGTPYDIVISSEVIVDEVMEQLNGLDIQNRVYYVPEYTYSFLWDDENAMPFWIPMDITKPRMPYLECGIVKQCNMNCNGCSTCANIHTPEFMDLSKFRSDMQQLKTIFSGIKYLKLYGGEPLLHKQLSEFVYTAREIFPDAKLVVHSNGLLIPGISDNLLDTMSRLDAGFVFTLYPETGKKKRLIKQKLDKHSVKYNFTEPVYEFRKTINRKGDYDAEEIYKNCCKCINLINGTLSCGLGFMIDTLEQEYDVNICSDKFQHCVNIYETKMNGREINRLLDSPFNLCKYCAFMRFNVESENYYHQWRRGETPSLEDWCI